MHFTSWFNMFIQTRRNSAICTLPHQLQASWVRQNKNWLNGCSNFASSTACNRCWTRFAKEHWCYWFNCWLVWFLCRKELCRLHRRLLLGQTCNASADWQPSYTTIIYNNMAIRYRSLQQFYAILNLLTPYDPVWTDAATSGSGGACGGSAGVLAGGFFLPQQQPMATMQLGWLKQNHWHNK